VPGVALVKMANFGLGFIVAILLARALGVEQYGTYSYIMVWVSIAAVIFQLGLPKLIVRETASALANSDWSRILSVWRWAGKITVVTSLVVIALVLIVYWAGGDRINKSWMLLVVIGAIFVPLMVLGNLRGAALRGLGHPVLGQLPEQAIRPAMFVFMVGTAIFAQYEVTVFSVMVLRVIAASLTFIIGVWMLWTVLPSESKVGVIKAPPENSAWLKSATLMAFSSGFILINNYCDILILGIFREPAEVGIYKIGFQTALLVSFGIKVIGPIWAPRFAKAFSEKKYSKLQNLSKKAATFTFITALAVSLPLILFDKELLVLIYTEEFLPAAMPMKILIAARLVTAFFGPLAIMLNMTGNEKSVAAILAVSATTNLFLNLLLIPRYGVEGAAFSTLVTVVLWNILLWGKSKKLLGMDSSALTK
jgi:O-antigen/teichoic acid export membrane protein